MLYVDYHALGYTGSEREFHQIIHLGKHNIAVNASALLSRNSNAFAQGILHSIDYANEHSHKVLEMQIASGTIKSDSTARKDIAWIHQHYQADIEARNQAPLSEDELIKNLLDDLAKSNPQTKKEIDLLRATVDETNLPEWFGVHDIVWDM